MRPISTSHFDADVAAYGDSTRAAANQGQATGPTPVIAQLLERIVIAAQPAEVFGSLAAAVVPALARACSTIVRESDGTEHYHGCSPLVPGSADSVVRIDTGEGATAGANAFTAAVLFHRRLPEPDDDRHTAPDLDSAAPVLARHAIMCVRLGRVEAALARQRSQTENLGIALESNRVISQAVGILMANHRLTADAAFSVLREVSQHTQRKLRDLAEDVVRTGVLEVPALPRARRLRSVGDNPTDRP